jgi:hypothetical protein
VQLEEIRMRFVNWAATLAAVAMIAMAFVGTGSASAWEFCKKPEVPCESRYVAGQIFNGALESGTTAHFTGNSEATCKSANIEFEQLSEFGSPVEEVINAPTFGNCNSTVVAEHLPWEMNIVDISGGEGNWKVTVTEAGGGQPGVRVGGCLYTATQMLFKINDTSLTGGAPKLFGTVSLSGECGSDTMTAAYRLAQNIYPG